MFANHDTVATTLQQAAAPIEVLTGQQTCRAFRPHAGYRSLTMLIGAAPAGYTVVGWGWMLWDFNWLRAKTADALVPRLSQSTVGLTVVPRHRAGPFGALRFRLWR